MSQHPETRASSAVQTRAADELKLTTVTTLEPANGKTSWDTLTAAMGQSNQALLLPDNGAHTRKTSTPRRSVATTPVGHTMMVMDHAEPRTHYSGGKAQHADDAAGICQHEMPAMLKQKSMVTWSYQLQLLGYIQDYG